MPPDRQLPTLYALLHSGARLLGWLTDLGAIVILGYIVRCWPEKGGTVAAGLVGSAIALLNDSWEMVSNVDTTGNFVPLSPPRAVLHDLFSLAVCMGGLMLLLFSDLRDQNVSQMVVFSNYRIRAPEIEAGRTIWNTKHEMFRAAQGFVAAVAYVIISCPIR
ncbi:unnamed protein product [Clonostachys solani]|uniref:Uncharacterized protein n=1 Tax=Clonostachys solani TaxID=160281 RepID=A0A9P0EAN0_9HYPO|nr:unnamed protein product [Clonostachys solani]